MIRMLEKVLLSTLFVYNNEFQLRYKSISIKLEVHKNKEKDEMGFKQKLGAK